jgi:hypothetical protein
MNTADSQNLPRSMTVTAAAEFAQRSASWVRRYRRFGPLVPVEIDGEQAVTTASLLALMRRCSKAKRREKLHLVVLPGGSGRSAVPANSAAPPTWLRLVVDNATAGEPASGHR